MRGFCLGFEKEIRKSSSIQVMHMTINRSEVHFEPEFCTPSHQSRQSVLLYIFCVKNRSKTKSNARQRESDLEGISLVVLWYSELVKCISQPPGRPGGVRDTHPYGDPLQGPPSQMLKCQGASQVLFLSQTLDVALDDFNPLSAQCYHCGVTAGKARELTWILL